jgi:DNA-binding NarL/FixJ family response regulator
MAKLRILAADAHRLTLLGIEHTLSRAADLQIVGTTHLGSQVLPLVRRTNADLVMLDVALPLMDGITCLKLVRQRHPRVKVVMLADTVDPADVRTALELGASGYIAKEIDPAQLATALRRIAQGTVEKTLAPPTTGRLPWQESEPFQSGSSCSGLPQSSRTALPATLPCATGPDRPSPATGIARPGRPSQDARQPSDTCSSTTWRA